jgi:hypothetical protein
VAVIIGILILQGVRMKIVRFSSLITVLTFLSITVIAQEDSNKAQQDSASVKVEEKYYFGGGCNYSTDKLETLLTFPDPSDGKTITIEFANREYGQKACSKELEKIRIGLKEGDAICGCHKAPEPALDYRLDCYKIISGGKVQKMDEVKFGTDRDAAIECETNRRVVQGMDPKKAATEALSFIDSVTKPTSKF